MSRRSRAILISGLTAFAATAAVALLCIRDWSGITGWAFLTMLWSETVFVAGLLFAERASELTEPVATRAVLYTVIAVYAVVNMAVSLLYMILFKKAYTSFGVIQVVLLAAALVITIVSFTASKGIRTENDRASNAVLQGEAMVNHLERQAADPACAAVSSMLRKLADELQFTDLSVIVQEDAEIEQILSEIETETGDGQSTESVRAKIDRLYTLIAQRKISARTAQTGRI